MCVLFICIDMLQSVKHNHSWLGSNIVVTKCKVSMSMPPSSSRHTSATEIPKKKAVVQSAFVIKVSKPFINCLTKNQGVVEKQLSQLHAAISTDTEMEQVTINPCLGSEDSKDWEENCRSVIKSFLRSVVTKTFSFPSKIKDIMVPIILGIIQSHSSLHIECDADSLTVVITGEKIKVNEVKEKLEEVLDSHIIKKESMVIEDPKFLSFLHVKLDVLIAKHPNIEATLLTNDNCLSMQGIKDSRIAFKNDLESLCATMIAVTVRISKDFVEFLSTPLGKTLLHQYLQDFESRVVIHFGPEGTLLLLCSQKSDGIKVAKVIQESVCSAYVPYPEVFVSSLRSKEWATLKSDVEESYCVSVSILGKKIRIIGDIQSLDCVSEDIQQFIEKECHTEKSIPLCGAQWRLLTTYMNKKWNKIEQKLKDQSKLKFSLPNEKDKKSFIVLKGEKPVVADLAKQVEDLISTMCTCPPLEQARPGTVKFFYSEKGKTLITGVEAQEKSCIQLDILQNFVPHSPTSVSKITEASVLLIQIYAEDQRKVVKTEERLQRIIEDQFTNEKIPNELISKFSQKQKDDLVRKAKQKHVQIIIETGVDLGYIQLKGDRTDVADLKFDIQEIIRQISSVESTKREAGLLQAKVKWQWLNDTGDYEDYDELANYHIENAYQQGIMQFTYTSEGVYEVFDFLNMEADDGQGLVKIKRVDIEDQSKEGNHVYTDLDINFGYLIVL